MAERTPLEIQAAMDRAYRWSMIRVVICIVVLVAVFVFLWTHHPHA